MAISFSNASTEATCLGCIHSQARLVHHRGLDYEFRCHHPDVWHQRGDDRIVGYTDERPTWCPIVGGHAEHGEGTV